jgi:hypothetical protein
VIYIAAVAAAVGFFALIPVAILLAVLGVDGAAMVVVPWTAWAIMAGYAVKVLRSFD